MMKKFLASLIMCTMIFASVMPAYAADTVEVETESVDLSQDDMELSSETESISEEDFPDNEEMFEAYAWKKLYGEGIQTLAMGTYDYLSDTDKAVYDILKEHFRQIADGEISDATITINLGDIWKNIKITAEDLGVSSLQNDGALSQAASTEIRNYIKPDFHQIIRCLLADCPYEAYWFHKTVGYSTSAVALRNPNPYSRASDWSYVKITNAEVRVGFKVLPEYAKDGKTGTFYADTEKTSAVITAVNNAKGVVAANASKADYDKLIAYKDYICDAVKYNNDAFYENIGNESYYGDPWQLIWVFDENPETDVVCEGYSKAFHYLCDLSSFDNNNILCWTVTGGMNGGGHMWNIITMEDEKNYMVDLTNCDGGHNLFLQAPVSGSWDNDKTGYQFADRKGRLINYVYDSDTRVLYDEDVLKLSETSYEPSTCSHDWVLKETTEPTCAIKGYRNYECSQCGDTKSETYAAALTTHTGVLEKKVTRKASTAHSGRIETTCSECKKTTVEYITPPEAIQLAYGTFYCTGEERTPVPTVYDMDGKEISSENYTVSYEGNVNPGVALLTVNFKGDYYEGTLSTTFKMALSKPELVSVENIYSAVKVTWEQVPCATGYYIYRSVGSGSYKKYKTITGGDVTTYTNTSADTNGKRYRYKIYAIYNNGSSVIKSSVSSVKTTYYLSRPSIKSISNSGAGKLYVRWGTNKKASGYQVQYALNSDFSDATTSTITSRSTVKKTFTGLSKGQTYYVRVRSYKSVSGVKYYGTWSVAKNKTLTK